MTREEWLIERSVKQAAKDTGLHPDVIKQVIQHESSGNPNAQSPTGPQGLMQLSKAAAIEGGIDPSQRFDIQTNIAAGANYYKQQVDKFGNKAYAAYHDGPGAVASGQPISKEGQWSPSQPVVPSRAEWLANRSAMQPTLTDQERKNIQKYDANTAAQNMPNFVPHDIAGLIPLAGPGIASLMRNFEQTPEANKLLEATKGQPYVGALTNYMLGQGDSKFDLKAGQEASKFIAGVGDLVDVARYALPGDHSEVLKSYTKRMQEQSANDKAMQYVNNHPGIGGVTGAMLPYVLSQYALGGPVGKYADSALSKLVGIPGEGVREAGGVISQAISTAADKPGLTGTLAKPFMDQFILPARKKAADKLLQVTLANPFRAGLVSRVAGGTVLGGLEGGLHYDNSIGQGIVSGGLGTLTGEAIRPYLIHQPNYNTKPVQDTIDWHTGEGGVHSPGVTTGSKSAQDFESGVRNTRYLKNTMGRHDQEMNIVNNRIAAKAMGLKNASTVEDFGPLVLRDHLSDLGKQYDKLEAGTVARLLPSDHNMLNGHIKSLVNDFDPEVQQVGKTVQSYANRIKAIDAANYPTRNPLTGQLQPKVVEGSTFKGLRSDLKATINSAYSNGNVKKAEALKPVLQMLDDSVERGLVLSSAGKTSILGEPVGIAEWKRLNEQTALTHLVKENGLVTSGSHIDTHKLNNYFQSHDADRFYTESGPPAITELHRLAKFGDIFKNTSKSALGTQTGGASASGYNSGRQSMMQKLLQTAVGDYLPLAPEMAMRLYMKGILGVQPAVTGWANMSGKGFGNPALYARALEQATHPWPSLYEGVANTTTDAVNEAKRIKKGFKKSYDNWIEK